RRSEERPAGAAGGDRCRYRAAVHARRRPGRRPAARHAPAGRAHRRSARSAGRGPPAVAYHGRGGDRARAGADGRAPGHHRYETAVEYAKRNPAATRKMMAFCTLEAPGLTILPNHRLIHDVADFTIERFVAAARPWFDVSPLPDPLAFQPTNRTIGVVTPDGAATLTALPNALEKIVWPAGTSDAWR